MNNFKLMSLSVLAVLALSFTGCGSDDGDDGGGENPPITGDPIVAYSCELSQEFNGHIITMKLGADGKLVCDDSNGYPELKFAPGVNEMIIAQAISVQEFTSVTDGSGTVTANLQLGTETIVGTNPEYGAVNCVNTYDVSLPIPAYSGDDIADFSIDYFQLITTTCPDWVNDDDDDDDDDDITSFSFMENITITETSGDVSKVSRYSSSQ